MYRPAIFFYHSEDLHFTEWTNLYITSSQHLSSGEHGITLLLFLCASRPAPTEKFIRSCLPKTLVLFHRSQSRAVIFIRIFLIVILFYCSCPSGLTPLIWRSQYQPVDSCCYICFQFFQDVSVLPYLLQTVNCIFPSYADVLGTAPYSVRRNKDSSSPVSLFPLSHRIRTG